MRLLELDDDEVGVRLGFEWADRGDMDGVGTTVWS